MRKGVLFLLGWVSAGVAFGAEPAAPSKAGTVPCRRLSVLAIGNSFTQSLEPELPKVAKAAGCELELAIFALGGHTFSNHWENCEAALADPSKRPYRVRGKWTNLPEMLASRKWDVITLQDSGNGGILTQRFTTWADRLVPFIRARQPQAKLYFQMTWPYLKGSESFCPLEGATRPVTQDEMAVALAHDFASHTRRYGVEVIPVGEAVRIYRRDLPVKLEAFTKAEIAACEKAGRLPDFKGELVGSAGWQKRRKGRRLNLDTIHFNREGKYLQACVWVATLLGVDVTDLPYTPEFGDDFKRRAPLIRRCAMSACQEWKASNP